MSGRRHADGWVIEPFTLDGWGSLTVQGADMIGSNPERMAESFPSSQPSDCPSWPAPAGVSLDVPGRELPAPNRKRGSSPPSLDRQQWKGAKLAEVEFHFWFSDCQTGRVTLSCFFFSPLVFHL